MRHALFLVLALGLAACTLNGAAPDAADGSGTLAAGATSPVAVDTGGIEVTPLSAPTGGAPASAAAVTAVAEAALAAPAQTASEAAPEIAPEVTVAIATPSTPHPRPRPAGLVTGEAVPEAAPPKSEPQLKCEASGGVWGQPQNEGGFMCQKMTRDGGKSCSKKGDCFGECLAPSQTCSPVVPLMGCNDVLDAQGRRVTLCLD